MDTTNLGILLFLNELQVGDQILKVNDTIVRDADHFYQLLRFAPPVASINLVRDANRAAELEAKVHIPPERARFIIRRDGYTYFVSFNFSFLHLYFC